MTSIATRRVVQSLRSSAFAAIAMCLGCSADAPPQIRLDVVVTSSEGKTTFTWAEGNVHDLKVSQCAVGDHCGCSATSAGLSGLPVWTAGGSSTQSAAAEAATDPPIGSPVMYGVSPDGDLEHQMAMTLTPGTEYAVDISRWRPCDSDSPDCQNLAAYGCAPFTD